MSRSSSHRCKRARSPASAVLPLIRVRTGGNRGEAPGVTPPVTGGAVPRWARRLSRHSMPNVRRWKTTRPRPRQSVSMALGCRMGLGGSGGMDDRPSAWSSRTEPVRPTRTVGRPRVALAGRPFTKGGNRRGLSRTVVTVAAHYGEGRWQSRRPAGRRPARRSLTGSSTPRWRNAPTLEMRCTRALKKPRPGSVDLDQPVNQH
jgi:hypothetical protein